MTATTSAPATAPAATSSGAGSRYIPGDPQAILAFARQIRATGEGTMRPIAAGQLRAEAKARTWVGSAGDAARHRLHVSADVWTQQARILDQLATAVEHYASTMTQAQADAARAEQLQNQARAAQPWPSAWYYHAQAQWLLNKARLELYIAAVILAGNFDQAAAALPRPAAAPAQPTSFERAREAVGTWWSDLFGSSTGTPDWKLKDGQSQPYVNGKPWPSSLYPPSALSQELQDRLGADPYTVSGRELPKHSGIDVDLFGFVGANEEVEKLHVGGWAFEGLYGGVGVHGIGTGDAQPSAFAGGILGTGAVVGPVEGGVLWEGGYKWNPRDGVEKFGSWTNPNLYFSVNAGVVEGGVLILNEPGESCGYTIFGGRPITPHVGGPVGPVEVGAQGWAGVGATVTVPSAATTPWQCIPYLPKYLRDQLPWWENKPGQH